MKRNWIVAMVLSTVLASQMLGYVGLDPDADDTDCSTRCKLSSSGTDVVHQGRAGDPNTFERMTIQSGTVGCDVFVRTMWGRANLAAHRRDFLPDLHRCGALVRLLTCYFGGWVDSLLT